MTTPDLSTAAWGTLQIGFSAASLLIVSTDGVIVDISAGALEIEVETKEFVDVPFNMLLLDVPLLFSIFLRGNIKCNEFGGNTAIVAVDGMTVVVVTEGGDGFFSGLDLSTLFIATLAATLFFLFGVGGSPGSFLLSHFSMSCCRSTHPVVCPNALQLTDKHYQTAAAAAAVTVNSTV
jgi:hypothetical protein